MTINKLPTGFSYIFASIENPGNRVMISGVPLIFIESSKYKIMTQNHQETDYKVPQNTPRSIYKPPSNSSRYKNFPARLIHEKFLETLF